MRRLFFRWAAAALLAGALMIPAAEAAQLQIDDRIVEPSAAWTEEGTPYVTLAALCQAADGYTLSWNGTAAALTAEDLELTATPGALYVEVNGRACMWSTGYRSGMGGSPCPWRCWQRPPVSS